jgi:hypothetical protein
MRRPIVKWLITIGVGVLIFMMPRPESVTVEAWTLLAIFIATIVGSIVQPLSGSAMVLLGRRRTCADSGRADREGTERLRRQIRLASTRGIFISRAMIKTGLGHRIALIFVRLIGRKLWASGTHSYSPISFSHRSFLDRRARRAALSCRSHAALPKLTTRVPKTAPRLGSERF